MQLLRTILSVNYAMLMLTWVAVSATVGWLVCEREWLNARGEQVLESHRRWLEERAHGTRRVAYDPYIL
jgi:hypothetical protein